LVGGRAASEAPDILAAAFALCGDAHRHAARWALAAAQGALAAHIAHGQTQAQARAVVRVDTLREHLRRIWLDWRAVTPPDGAGLHWPSLANCPLMRAGRRGTDGADVADVMHGNEMASSRRWIEEHVLGLPAADWSTAWSSDPAAFLCEWTATGAVTPARWLAGLREPAQDWVGTPRPLLVHTVAEELTKLAAAWYEEPAMSLRPQWRGAAMETGTWTRAADPAARGNAYAGAWLRLASRLADIAQLVADGGENWLAQGGCELGTGQGLGYCEMARGLLMHRVQLEPCDSAGEPRIADWQVLAPTEWNFHPQGVVAQMMAVLDPASPPWRVKALATCFDPCVPLDVAGA
jgi:hypothetical protein